MKKQIWKGFGVKLLHKTPKLNSNVPSWLEWMACFSLPKTFSPHTLLSVWALLDWKVEDLCWIVERSNFIFPLLFFSFYSCKGHSCKTCVLFVKLWNVVCFCHPFTTITLQLCHHHSQTWVFQTQEEPIQFNSIQTKPIQTHPTQLLHLLYKS